MKNNLSLIVARDGFVLLFQIIWKGKSTQCHVRHIQPAWDPRIYHDHAVKKVQTTLSFNRMLDKVATALVGRRRDLGLAASFPAVIIMDNAPSHSQHLLQQPASPQKPSPHLFQVTTHPTLWVWFTLKNRSHTQNPIQVFFFLHTHKHQKISLSLGINI